MDHFGWAVRAIRSRPAFCIWTSGKTENTIKLKIRSYFCIRTGPNSISSARCPPIFDSADTMHQFAYKKPRRAYFHLTNKYQTGNVRRMVLQMFEISSGGCLWETKTCLYCNARRTDKKSLLASKTHHVGPFGIIGKQPCKLL